MRKLGVERGSQFHYLAGDPDVRSIRGLAFSLNEERGHIDDDAYS